MFPWILSLLFSSFEIFSSEFIWRFILSSGSIPCVISALCLMVEDNPLTARQAELELAKRTGRSSSIINTDPVFTLLNSKSADYLRQKRSSVHGMNSTNNNGTGNGGNNGQLEDRTAVFNQIKDKSNYKTLFAAGSNWFCFDAVSYGVSLLGGKILNAINKSLDVSSSANIQMISYQQILALSIGVPVSIFSLVVVLPRIGLKHLQTASFVIMTITFLVFALVFDYLLKVGNTHALVAVYCVALTSVQSGAKITTFAIPSTVFHKSDRMLYNGIAAGTYSLFTCRIYDWNFRKISNRIR